MKIAHQKLMPTLKEWLRVLSRVELEPSEYGLISQREDILRSLILLKSRMRDSKIRLEHLGISEGSLNTAHRRSVQEPTLKVM